MRLSNYLESIPRNETVAQLNQMLDSAHVNISWSGKRMVTVDGYEGAVEVNQLALKYLHAEAFKWDGHPTLQDRLETYALWGKVKKLYIDSEEKVQGAYKYLTPLRDLLPYRKAHCQLCAGNPFFVIGSSWPAKKLSIFDFTPQEYSALWPGVGPQGRSWTFVDGRTIEKWSANREMIEAAVAREASSEATERKV